MAFAQLRLYMAEWALPATWVPLVRLFALLLGFVAAYVGVHWLRPSVAALRAGIVAGGVQLCLGILLDCAGVHLGYWHYLVTDGLVLGVPADLHLAWALVWGVLFALYSPSQRGSAVRYALLWWAITITADGLGAAHVQALVTHAGGLAWLGIDAVMVGVLLMVTLWLYRSVLQANLALPVGETSRSIPAAPAKGVPLRSLLYLLLFGSFSVLFIPEQLLALSGKHLWPLPAGSLGSRFAWLVAAALPLSGAAWAVREFARSAGTPLPYDPPQRLATSGPYAFVRNPMQLGVILAVGIMAAYYRSWWLLVYALDLALLSEVLFERYEAPELEARFGAAYTHYRSQVRRWLPMLRAYVSPS